MIIKSRKKGLKSHKRKSFSKKSILREPFVVIFHCLGWYHELCSTGFVGGARFS